MTKAKTFTGKLLAAGVLIVALLATVFAVPAMAAEVDDETTTATITFDAGDLILDQAPAINFGTQDISGTTYTAQTVTPNLQVSDQRGANTGWRVTAQLDGFLLGGTTPTLAGSNITITGATTAAVNGTTGTSPASISPIVLNAGDTNAVNVFNAPDTTGGGVWQSVWPAAGTVLTIVPGTAEIGTSTANLNWSLDDVPA